MFLNVFKLAALAQVVLSEVMNDQSRLSTMGRFNCRCAFINDSKIYRCDVYMASSHVFPLYLHGFGMQVKLRVLKLVYVILLATAMYSMLFS